jgi:hypothetical protein
MCGQCRHGFGYVVEVAERLVRTLKQCGPEDAINIDEAVKRQTMDVIGLVGFGKDFGSAERLRQTREHDPLHNLSLGNFLFLMLCGHVAFLRRPHEGPLPLPSRARPHGITEKRAVMKGGWRGAAGQKETTLRMGDPLRKYRFWQPVGTLKP